MQLTVQQFDSEQVSVSFTLEDELGTLFSFPRVESAFGSSKVDINAVATTAVSMAGGKLRIHSAEKNGHTIEVLVTQQTDTK